MTGAAPAVAIGHVLEAQCSRVAYSVEPRFAFADTGDVCARPSFRDPNREDPTSSGTIFWLAVSTLPFRTPLRSLSVSNTVLSTPKTNPHRPYQRLRASGFIGNPPAHTIRSLPTSSRRRIPDKTQRTYRSQPTEARGRQFTSSQFLVNFAYTSSPPVQAIGRLRRCIRRDMPDDSVISRGIMGYG